MAKPKTGLALLLGMPSKGGRSEDMAAEFEQAAVDAFPDMEGQPERIAALKQCIQACMDSYDDDSGA